jgi:hypothetical protein
MGCGLDMDRDPARVADPDQKAYLAPGSGSRIKPIEYQELSETFLG